MKRDQDERVEENARDVASAVQEAFRESADEGMTKAGEGVHAAAESLRDRVEGDGVAATASSKVAERLDRAGDYLTDKDSEEFMSDARRFVKEHPVQALAGAIMAGFVLGKLLR
jgi:ElaB/YqjD/DUF883 family membrane-anchored ribosome-binding protein